MTNVPNAISPKLRALIIDDESDICFLLSSILKQKNISAIFAGSLAEADHILETGNGFYLIFLDNHLPDGLGTAYVPQLKKNFPESKVVMITAHDTSWDRKKAEDDGIDFFIGKPFSRETIFNTIDHLTMKAH